MTQLPYRTEIVIDLQQKVITDLSLIISLTKENRDPKLLKYLQDGLPVLQAALEAAKKMDEELEKREI